MINDASMCKKSSCILETFEFDQFEIKATGEEIRIAQVK